MTQPAYGRVLDEVRAAITEILHDRGEEVGPISEDQPLYEYAEGVTGTLGLDSLDALDLISVVEDRLGVTVPEELEYQAIRSVGDLASVVTGLLPSG